MPPPGVPRPVAASTPDVVVAWSAGPATDLLRDRLAGAVRERLTGLTGPVHVAHVCPRCGSDRHGRPRVVGQPELGLSVAYTASSTVVAGVAGSEVGVDVEAEGDPRFGSVADALLHPREPDPGPRLVARTWVRKEALLKALGTGLSVDPRTVELGAPGAPPRALRLPAPFDRVPVGLCDVDLDDATIGCVAVVGVDAPRVSVIEVAAAARAR